MYLIKWPVSVYLFYFKYILNIIFNLNVLHFHCNHIKCKTIIGPKLLTKLVKLGHSKVKIKHLCENAKITVNIPACFCMTCDINGTNINAHVLLICSKSIFFL